MKTTNPIHKVLAGWAYSHTTPPKRIRRWAFTCPTCGVTSRSNHYGWTNTRKAAKDEYHRHCKKEHKPGLVG